MVTDRHNQQEYAKDSSMDKDNILARIDLRKYNALFGVIAHRRITCGQAMSLCFQGTFVKSDLVFFRKRKEREHIVSTNIAVQT